MLRPSWTRILPVTACLGLLLPGCGVAKRPIAVVPDRPLRQASLDEVLTAYDRYCNSLQSLRASGDLDLRDLRKGQARKLGVRVVAGRGGRLYIKGSIAVVTAIEVVSDGQRFWLQVPSKKTVWTGSASSAPKTGVEDAPYDALRPSDLLAGLLCDPLAPATEDAVTLESDREAFSLSVARLRSGQGVVSRRVWLDRETLAPLRLRTYDDRGDLVREATIGSWTGGQPRRVQVVRPREGFEAVFTFDEVQPNVAVPEKAFAPRTPPDYKTVEVGASS